MTKKIFGSVMQRVRRFMTGLAEALADKIGKFLAIPEDLTLDLQTAQKATERYLQLADLSALDTACEAWERVLIHPTLVTNPDMFQPAVIWNDAGMSFLRRYEAKSALADLDRALALLQQAVGVTVPNAPNLPMYLNNLGNSLGERYVRLGQVADLEQAIMAYQQAIAITVPDAPYRPMILNNLGVELRSRYELLGQLADLEQAIDLCQRVVATTAPNAPDLPSRLNNLANGLRDRYKRMGQLADLEQAIALYQRAAGATAADNPRLSGYLNNLGTSLEDRYTRLGQITDLERAIAIYERAMAVSAPDGSNLLGLRSNLGGGLVTRYERIGQVADLERAIIFFEQAVAATLPDTPSLPDYLNNLGLSLNTRYKRLGRVSDLERAIVLLEQAVVTTAPSVLALPSYLNNLSVALSNRYERLGQMADLERAIAVCEQAVAATAPDAPDLPRYINNLGTVLSERYSRLGQGADLEKAITVFRQVLDATAPDAPDLPSILNNLGNGLHARYKQLGIATDLEEARTNYERACQRGMEVNPAAVLMSSRAWGRWASERRAWKEALRAYGYGRTALDRLYQLQPLQAERAAWLREGVTLPGGMAYALAKLGRLEEAALVLEQGRARELRAALARDRADLSQLEAEWPDLATRYRDAAGEVRWRQTEGYRPPQGSTLAQAITQAQQELDAAVAAIRDVPDHADFLAPPTFAEIARAVEPGIPLVYLFAAPTGSLTLLLHRPSAETPPTIEAIQGDTLTEDALREWLMGPANENRELGGWFGAYRRWLDTLGDKQEEPRHRQAWHDTLEATTRQLWPALMGPLVAHLRELGAERAVLVPSGLLALLPLHAAWVEEGDTRRYALDDVAFSYAPSAYALNAARATAQRAPSQRLVAVDEPLPITPASPLPNSNAEVAAIASLFADAQTFRHAQATRAALLAALPGAHIAHFSCHGGTDWGNALDSALIMAHNEPLTVRDVLALHLSGARLAILSACETGLVGTRLPDEAVALPAALVQAGFAGVVASLWSVSDLSTAMLMEYFYHLWQEEGLEPAVALQRAQRWVRDSTNAEKRERLDFHLAPPHRMSPASAATFLDRMDKGKALPDDDRTFQHPFCWAAFSLTGV